MKKYLLSVMMLGVFIGVSAQVTWNVKVGVGMSSFLFSETGDADTKSKVVWRVGFGIEKPLSENWLFMPSLEYAQKGAKVESTEGVQGGSYYWKNEGNICLSYLQAPLLFAHRTPLGADVNMTLKAGPYLAYAVSGKEKDKQTLNTKTSSSEIDLFDNDDFEGDSPSNRFDAGLTLGLGFEYHCLEVGLEFEQGFTNFFDYDSAKIKNSAYYLTVGYKF